VHSLLVVHTIIMCLPLSFGLVVFMHSRYRPVFNAGMQHFRSVSILVNFEVFETTEYKLKLQQLVRVESSLFIDRHSENGSDSRVVWYF